MNIQTPNQKMPKGTTTKERYCKGLPGGAVTIPLRWNLTQLQRSFIDSMIDNKNNEKP